MTNTTIRVALDWTPNTIHSGLYIALRKGFYSNLGLDVELLPPTPEYTTTPAKLLADNQVDLAICPSETIIAYAENVSAPRSKTPSEEQVKDDVTTKHERPVRLEAIYAILQRDASAIAAPNLSSIVDLQNGTYGSYNARYEGSVIRHMISKAGGNGNGMKIESATAKLSLFEELCSGSRRIDATWIFMPWEGIEASMDGVKLHTFTLSESGIPYGYSPVIARKMTTTSDSTGLSDEVLEKFVKATRRGYEIAQRDVVQAVKILSPFCEPFRSMEFLDMSQESINEYYGGEGRLGEMREGRWKEWVDWLEGAGLVKVPLDVNQLYTNRFNVD